MQPDPLHTLNTLPAGTVAELVDTRSRRYVARLPESGPIPLSQRFCFGDLSGRVDAGVDGRWADPGHRFRSKLVAALVDAARPQMRRLRQQWQLRGGRRARRMVVDAPGTGVVRALLVSLLVEALLGALVVAGVVLRGRHA